MKTIDYNITNNIQTLPISKRIQLNLRLILLFLIIGLSTNILSAQTLNISKSNNATNPIASGLAFTYTITYSWSGGAPGLSLIHI